MKRKTQEKERPPKTSVANTHTRAKFATGKAQSTEKHNDLISYDQAWRKTNFFPSAKRLAPNLREADQLLRELNGGYYQVGASLWRCQAQIAKQSQSLKKENTQSLLINVNGANCLLKAEMPLELRKHIERMTEPFRLEELPLSVALGIISLKLQPIVNQLLLAPTNIINYICSHKKPNKEQKKLAQRANLAIEITALPITNDGEIDDSRAALPFHLHLAYPDANLLRSALRPFRKTRRYPPNLHATWNFFAEGTAISIEEFHALEEGDILILA